jgi:hypothetical protein
MSTLQELAKSVGSLRYARDLLDDETDLNTRPWWWVPSPTKAALIMACATGPDLDPERERVIPRTNSSEGNPK